MMRSVASLAALAALSACAGEMELSPAQAISMSAPTASVTARAETAPVGTAHADAADDPAIWRNPADPAASLVIGTDKKAGIYVYGLDGSQKSFIAAGDINNVDLRDGMMVNGKPSILVAASDRTDKANAKLALFTLDPASASLTRIATLPAGPGEAYGFCMWKPAGGPVHAFVIVKPGRIVDLALDLDSPEPKARIARTMSNATLSEGCVADDRTRQLYVSEEDVAIWRFDLNQAQPEGMKFALVDRKHLFADSEGLAIAPKGADGGWLIASSQGDNAYTFYTLPGGAYAGRFRLVDGVGANGQPIGGTSDTDGIEVMLGDFGPAYPGGLFVAQDGDNAPNAQNFKLVAWDDVAKALGLGE